MGSLSQRVAAGVAIIPAIVFSVIRFLNDASDIGTDAEEIRNTQGSPEGNGNHSAANRSLPEALSDGSNHGIAPVHHTP